MYLDRAIAQFPKFCQKIGKSYVLKPCSESQIKEYEAELNLSFPEAYKELLLWLGESAGKFMDYYVLCGSCLLRNREDALEMMQEDGCLEPLSEDAIVFAWGHQGAYFSFIRASEGDNSPVHDYDPGKGITWNADPNLETFIIRYMNDFQKAILESINTNVVE